MTESADGNGHLFVAFTPYHAMVSALVARELVDVPERVLVLLEHCSGAERLLRSLCRWERNPFTRVVRRPSWWNRASTSDGRRRIAANIRFFRELCVAERPSRVYVGNDWPEEVQAALHYAKAVRPQAVGTFLEDGMGAYADFRYPPRSRAWLLLKRLQFGRWVSDVQRPGTSRWIDEALVFFPELLAPELRHLRVSAIQAGSWPHLQGWAEHYVRELATPLPSQVDLVLILTRSLDVSPEVLPRYRTGIHAVVEAALRADMRVAVKHHPLEPRLEFVALADPPRVSILPPELPLEFLYLARPTIRCVVGGDTTGMVTARSMLPAAKVVSYRPLCHHPDVRSDRVYREIGVSLVQDAAALEQEMAEVRGRDRPA